MRKLKNDGVMINIHDGIAINANFVTSVEGFDANTVIINTTTGSVLIPLDHGDVVRICVDEVRTVVAQAIRSTQDILSRLENVEKQVRELHERH